MNWIEITATVFGFLCVLLTIRKNIWCWPMGLVQVLLFIYIFHQAKLYSDMILHVVYVGLQIYGWWYWLRGVDNAKAPVTRVQKFPVWLGAVGVLTLLWGWGMGTWTDAALPMWDAFTTMASLAAQWLLSKKKLENWVLWIAVDVVAIGVYWSKGLYFTSGLYVTFLVMATIGLISWTKTYKKQEAENEVDTITVTAG